MTPTFLSSYNIDGFWMPEWVAFKIERPVWGVSHVPHTSRDDCEKKGGAKFFMVLENGIRTPDASFTLHYNLGLLRAGRDAREGIQKAQLCLPTNFLTCSEKEGTYAMTNVIPINKYIYTMNIAEADKAMRKYVADDVLVPRPGFEEKDLMDSDKYHPLYAVAGPHFHEPKTEKFQWVYENEDIYNQASVKKGVIPHAVWQAVLDPQKLQTAPKQATVAWYCNNRPRGPWPVKGSENAYENGPKLCRVMSLAKLEEITGIRPFPDLPLHVRQATPSAAVWHLSERF